MVQRELALRKQNKGTLHRYGPKKKDADKWGHNSYQGWIRFQKCLGGVVVALVQAKDHELGWQLLTSFIGFLDRNFRDDMSNISLSYESEE
jgi:hypothetical protein